MLRSLHRVANGRFSVTLHDDGSLSEKSAIGLANSFPGIEVIPRSRSRTQVGDLLNSWPEFKKWHASDYTAVKWIDPYLIGDSEFVVFIDTDVLFFDDPQELLSPSTDSIWQEDIAYMLHISSEEAVSRLGGKPIPAVNSGIGCIRRDKFSLPFAVEVHELLYDEMRLSECMSRGLPRNDDQTFHALLSAREGHPVLLPRTYLISCERDLHGIVAKHYVGSFRYLFWEEGIPRVAKLLGLPLPAWLRERA